MIRTSEGLCERDRKPSYTFSLEALVLVVYGLMLAHHFILLKCQCCM